MTRASFGLAALLVVAPAAFPAAGNVRLERSAGAPEVLTISRPQDLARGSGVPASAFAAPVDPRAAAPTGAAARPSATSAPGTITSVVGSVGVGPALNLGLLSLGNAVRAGALYHADLHWNAVRRLDLTSGMQSTVAGTGAITGGHRGDGGPATQAELYIPFDVTFDSGGNMYIADATNQRVRKVDTSGVITTVAGNGQFGYGGDGGPATLALLWGPAAVAVDRAGNLYITDQNNGRIRRVDTNGIITTVVGGGPTLGDGGPAILAALSLPVGIAFDGSGNLYIADQVNNRIRRVEAGANGTIDGTDTITTVAGNGTAGFSGDGGPATSAQVASPSDVAFDTAGNLYVADNANNRVRRIDAQTKIITTVAGNGTAGFSGDGGPATAAAFSRPGSVSLDAAGNLYVTDYANQRLRKVDAAGIVTTIAGNGTAALGGDGGDAANAQLNFGPRDVDLDAAGNLYVVDNFNNRVRKVDSSGAITTYAGAGKGYFYGPPFDPNGPPTFSGDGGPATEAHMSNPTGAAFDRAGNLYIADTSNQRVRKVNPAGIIDTVAGTGTAGYNGDNIPAKTAHLWGPAGLATDSKGNLYITDQINNRIRKVDAAGTITTFAGGAPCPAPVIGTGCYAGDGGPATQASLNFPGDLAVDVGDNVYIADRLNNRVRRVDAKTNVITTYAGNGTASPILPVGDGGPATLAQVADPTGVAFDAAGNLYISNTGNARIRKVDTSPQRIITTVAGNGTSGFSGDGGPATAAELTIPFGLAVSGSGDLYIADWLSRRVRRVTGVVAPPTALRIVSFGAYRYPGGVVVRWRSGSSAAPFGYNVFREHNGKRVRLTKPVVPASGGGGRMYRFVDRDAPLRRTLRYWLQEVSLDGSGAWHGPAVVARS